MGARTIDLLLGVDELLKVLEDVVLEQLARGVIRSRHLRSQSLIYGGWVTVMFILFWVLTRT